MNTQLTDTLIESLRVPRELLLHFFVTFSRFEYALKAGDFRKNPPHDADVSWSKYICWLEVRSLTELDPVLDAGQYLLDEPPKKLVMSNDTPRWEVPIRSGQSNIRFLVEGIQRARNNLFHGGKWLTRPDLPHRNRDVLSASVEVLEALVEFDDTVGNEFRSRTFWDT